METTALVPVPSSDLAVIEPIRADMNPASVYLAHLAPGSRRTMRQALDAIACLIDRRCDAMTLPWQRLDFQHTAAIRAKLLETHSPAGTRKMLSALRGTLKAAWKLGLMDAETYHRGVSLDTVKGSRLPRGRALEPLELFKVFAAVSDDPTPAGVRDSALLSVLLAGLRRAEVVSLDLSDYSETTGGLKVRSGKGAKDRTAYLPNGGTTAMADWLSIRGTEPGPLFCRVLKNGALQMNRLSSQAIHVIVAKRCSGIAHCSPHDWRRTMISTLLTNVDVTTVASLVGHSDVRVTASYDRRPEEAKAKAMSFLTVPCVRRTGSSPSPELKSA